MHHIELSCPNSTKVLRYHAPSEWNEITQKQLLHWASICIQKISRTAAYTQAVRVFYNMPPKLYGQLKLGQILQLAGTLHFLEDENRLSSWLIPRFWKRGRRYYGPIDNLSNLTIAEYRRTELYYGAYVRTGEKRCLLLLIATLYRQRRNTAIDDDLRRPLTEYGVQQRCARFRTLSPLLQQAILLNYEGCRNHLIKNYAPSFTTSSSNSEDLPDLETVIEALAGDKFGTIAQTEQTNIHRFFRHLVSTIARAEEEKKSLK